MGYFKHKIFYVVRTNNVNLKFLWSSDSSIRKLILPVSDVWKTSKKICYQPIEQPDNKESPWLTHLMYIFVHSRAIRGVLNETYTTDDSQDIYLE